jgi:SAM-dependent methyltransferase
MKAPPFPRLYADLAPWWPLFSPPNRYAEEAAWILDTLIGALGARPSSILELGSGGGNTASHLTRLVRMTLTDLAPGMLEVSRRLNPDAEHVEGDMRSLRLGKTFDAVMIHDAIMYITTDDDLVATLATARAHLNPEGALVVLPDYVAETFASRVETGGHDDGSGRGLRYLAWVHPPVAGATVHDIDFAVMLRVADGSVDVLHDRHRMGIFSRESWRRAFVRAGFAPPDIRPDPWQREVFVARPREA